MEHLKVLSLYLSEGLRKAMRNLRQEGWLPSRDMNPNLNAAVLIKV
jgi:hypothetical protein